MKRIFFILIAMFVIGISNAQHKPYVTFQAEIANRNGDSIYIRTQQKILKLIKVNKKGVFKDTLKIAEGFYLMYDGKEYTQMYLKNGYNLKLKLDAKNFDESIVYTGVGEKENNYLAKYTLTDSKFDYEALLASDEGTFNKTVSEKKAADLATLQSANLDSNFTALQKKNIENSLDGLNKKYQMELEIKKLNNTPSPSFNYENHAGGISKLEDFKGKYVYIDVWATWCGPCRAEIPHLKRVEEEYKGKNIAFVSISVDVKKDYEKWKKFVGDKALGGVQLFADNDWKSDFVRAMKVNGIPRFIIIDPNGVIVNADAPRPSSPDFGTEMNKLLN
jgi:thiol-disulfide isomerase/thioredoxin